MRFVSICIVLSVGLSSNSVYAMDTCRDAFGASDALVANSNSVAIRSVDPRQAEAQASLEAVNKFLEPSGLLTPKMLNLEITASAGSDARYDFFASTVRMRPEFTDLAPLDVHAPFIHEYGHSVFEFSALRDSSNYRRLVKTMATYQKLARLYKSLSMAHENLIQAKEFDQALALRPELLSAKAALEAFQKVNSQDLDRWLFSGVYQEAFADLLSVFFLKNPSALLKFSENPLREYVEVYSPDHWMQRDYHYALSPFVRHVVQKTLVKGEIASPQALKIVHRLILEAMGRVQSNSNFAVGDPKKLNKVDMLKREAYIQGYKVSDLNRDLIFGFDQAIAEAQ